MQKLSILTLALISGLAFAGTDPNPFMLTKRLPAATTAVTPFMPTNAASSNPAPPVKAASSAALVKVPVLPEAKESKKGLALPPVGIPAPAIALPPPALPMPASAPAAVGPAVAKTAIKPCKLSIPGGKAWVAEAHGSVLLVPFIKPVGCSLALSSSVDWLTVDVDTDDHLVIRVAPTDGARQGAAVLASRTHTLEVEVRQKAPAKASVAPSAGLAISVSSRTPVIGIPDTPVEEKPTDKVADKTTVNLADDVALPDTPKK